MVVWVAPMAGAMAVMRRLVSPATQLEKVGTPLAASDGSESAMRNLRRMWGGSWIAGGVKLVRQSGGEVADGDALGGDRGHGVTVRASAHENSVLEDSISQPWEASKPGR